MVHSISRALDSSARQDREYSRKATEKYDDYTEEFYDILRLSRDCLVSLAKIREPFSVMATHHLFEARDLLARVN